MREFDVFKDEDHGSYQLRTKTTLFNISFDDIEQEDIFKKIVKLLKEDDEITIKNLISELLPIANESKVMEVLYMLNENLLLPLNISNEITDSAEIVYNEFSIPPVDNLTIAVFGQNIINKKLQEGLSLMGVQRIESIPFNADITEEFIQEYVFKSDFVIVNANEWSPFHIEIINKSALNFNKPWLYIGGMEESTVKIGPFFYGSETGCYDCLISRIKSNSEYPEFLVSYENFLRSQKSGSKPDQSPLHQVMIANVVSDLALIEIHKFLYKWAVLSTWRTVINFDITNFKSTHHTLLKKPYCTTCKPELKYNKAPWLEAITLK